MPLRVHSSNELHNELGPQRRLAVFAPVVAAPVVPTYTEKVEGYNPIAYWVLGEAAGATAVDQINSPAQDGAYTGVTLGQPGIGDGNTCPLFDGLNDYVDCFTATLAGVFDGTEGTLAIWAKVFNVGVWTDSAWRYTCSPFTNASNLAFIARAGVNNEMRYRYRPNGINEQVNQAGLTSVVFNHYAITWTDTGDEMRAFFNGIQQGPTQTGLNTWAGAITRFVIGAFTTVPGSPWYGWLAHCAVWDTPLTQPQIADLATV